MSESRFKKPASPESAPRTGRPLLTGILVGLLLGVGLCSSIAIWIARSPSPFTNRALQTMGVLKGNGAPIGTNESSSGGDVSAASNCPPAPASDQSTKEGGNPSGNTNSQASPSANNNSAGASADAASGSPSSDQAKPATPGTLFVQVGAFSSQDEAVKQVELIAQLTGQKARVWTSSNGDAGKPLYRVRLGGFAQPSETVELTQILKSNGVSYVLVRPAVGESPL